MSTLPAQLIGKTPAEVTKSVVGVLLVVAVVYLLVKELSPPPLSISPEPMSETKSTTSTTTKAAGRGFSNAPGTKPPVIKGSTASTSGSSRGTTRKRTLQPKHSSREKKRTIQPESVSRGDEGVRPPVDQPTPETPLTCTSRIVYEGGFRRLLYDTQVGYDIAEITIPPNKTRYTHRLLGEANLHCSSTPEEDQHFVLSVSHHDEELLRTPLTPFLLATNGGVVPFYFDCCVSINYSNTTNMVKFLIRHNQTNSNSFIHATSFRMPENESRLPLSIRLGTNKPEHGSFAFLLENVILSE